MAVAEYLNNSKELQISTGNITAWSELNQRQFNDLSEQLHECLRLQLRRWNPQPQDKHSNAVCLCASSKQCAWPVDNEYNRGELKVTLKIFLHDYNPSYIRNAVLATLQQLRMDQLDVIIVAFPLEIYEEEVGNIERIMPVWQTMEQLVQEMKVVTIGVADAELPVLSALYDRATVKPRIDHYSLEGCCAVPPDLMQYAKARDIQLLTHNDPACFLQDETLHEILTDAAGLTASSAAQWHPQWVARYTVMIQCRSVISHKAYIVDLAKQDADSL